MSTYIKLYRSLLDHDTLSNDNTAFLVFVKLLMVVDRRTGTYTTGRRRLALLTNLKGTTAWGALHRLQTDNIVTLSSDKRKTTIYICNWATYQSSDDNRKFKPLTEPRPKTDTKQELRKRSNIYSQVEKEALAALNEIVNRQFQVIPKALGKTLQRFTVAQIRQALTQMVKDEWHKSKLGSLPADYMLREETIDKFLNVQPAKQLSKSQNTVVKPKGLNLSGKDRLKQEYRDFGE